MGIISLVLISAYATTNRNVRATQDTGEQAQAQKIVQRQVELLRSDPTGFGANTCFSPAGVPIAGAGNCRVDSSGAIAPAGYTGVVYRLNIAPNTPTVGVYTISADWESLSGSTRNISVFYKVAL
jgi:hypothetical protein